MGTDTEADRGRPSYLWRAGQDRRMTMIASWAKVSGARALDVGCGVGLYSWQMARDGAWTVGSEIEWPRARAALDRVGRVVVARGEELPFVDGAFETVLLHEVLEHVSDDRRALAEAARVLAERGRIVVFVPNRWWPFETHGVYWRGRYRFGNAPLINYLPDGIRNRLVPHARAYTTRGLHELLTGLPLVVVEHARVFPGFDRLAAAKPAVGQLARSCCQLLARTPAAALGLSHFLVLERLDAVEGA